MMIEKINVPNDVKKMNFKMPINSGGNVISPVSSKLSLPNAAKIRHPVVTNINSTTVNVIIR